MQRLLAGIVAVAMLLTSGSAVPRHLHAFTGHNHDDHEHGVADHLHLAAAPAPHAEADADHAAEIEGCDPGTHAVSVTFVCASPESSQSFVAAAIEPITLQILPAVTSSMAPADVRVHGPPRSRRTPPRAPPVVHPA